jgi:hypothetical protein
MAGIAASKAFAAANWSIATYFCGVFATYLIIDKDYAAIIAYVIGGYFGTYYAVIQGSNKMVEDKTCF